MTDADSPQTVLDLRQIRWGLTLHAANVIPALLGFFLVPFVLAKVGTDAFGIWSLFVFASGLLGATEYGMVVTIVREVSGAGDRARIVRAAVYAFTLGITGGFLILTASLSGAWTGIGNDSALVGVAFAVAFIAERVSAVCAAWHSGHQRFQRVAAIGAAAGVGRVLALAGALVIDPSITALAVANALSSIAVAVVWSVMTPLPFYSGDGRLPVSRKEISSVFSVQLAGTAGQAFWYAPPLIASAYVGTSWAADYQIAFKVPQALLGLCGAVGGTFLPVMSSAKKTDQDRLENVGAAIRVTLIVVLPIALVTIICAARFISWWTPQAGFAAAPLLQMLLIAVVVIAVFGGFWQELLASGREKLLAATQLGMSVFAVLATVVLMRWYPNTAAAIAILASSLGGCAIMLWRVGGPELHRIVGIVRRSTKGLLVPVLLAVSGTSVAGRAPIESSGLRLTLAAATGLVLYAAGFLITGHYGAGIRHQLRHRR